MKIAIGTMMHESNNFSTILTELSDFHPLQGEQIFSQGMKRLQSTAGIVNVLESEGVEIVSTYHARAIPSGTVTKETFAKIKAEILAGVQAAEDLDGICLALHGSMYAEQESDPEGNLLASLRELVGPNLPIVCALDMHTTLTHQMVEAATAFTLYRTAPHIDEFETGQRAARLLMRILKEKPQMVTRYIRMPMLLCGEQSESSVSPMKELIELAKQVEAELPGIASADYLLGFPWSETPHHGISAIVHGELEYADLLDQAVRRLAQSFWDKRHEFVYTTEAYSMEEAISVALQEASKPVIICDTGDNPTAGASQNITSMLETMLKLRTTRSLVAVIADHKSYTLCKEAGIGENLSLELGRLKPEPHSPGLKLEATVLDIREPFAVGTAVLDVSGITVLVTETRVPVHDPKFLDDLDLRLEDYDIIVVKSGYLSPQYKAVVKRNIFALTPGETNIDMKSIPYRHLPRPMYPIDHEMIWEMKSDFTTKQL